MCVSRFHVHACVSVASHRSFAWAVRMHMRIGDGNAFFLMADSIDLYLLNADWWMNYKQLWLLVAKPYHFHEFDADAYV